MWKILLDNLNAETPGQYWGIELYGLRRNAKIFLH